MKLWVIFMRDKRKNITTEIAYIAGFFDGEGCIRIKETFSSHYLIVHITNTNRAILEYIKSLFGGSINFQEKGVNRTVYQYHLTCGDAYNFLKTVNGFLREKRKQSEYGMKFHEIKSTISRSGRCLMARNISEMKREPNIYENPELLESK